MLSHKTTLVFSSGGINGIYFIGCLKALEETDILHKVTCIRGSSAGAFFGTLVSLRYTSTELEEALLSIDTGSLINIKIDNILSFLDTFGIDTGEKLQKVVEVFLIQKMGRAKVTFAELYTWNKIHLVIVGTCISSSSLSYFDHLRTPNMSVSTAVRISSSIPFLFTPVQYKEVVYIDGGVKCHLPMPECDTDKPSTSHNVIGFTICRECTDHMETIFTYMNAILDCMNKEQKTKSSKPELCSWIIPIQTSHNSFSFEMCTDSKKEAIQSGYTITQTYLSTHDIDTKHNDKEKISKCLIRKRMLGPQTLG